ncbi:MAG TPA: NepR family anti-sigma factor [Rhizomicrobium sp.]
MADKLRGSADVSTIDPGVNVLGRSAARTPRPQTHRAQQKAITQGLRKFFDSVASEPVPDEFMALLRQIDGKKEEGI